MEIEQLEIRDYLKKCAPLNTLDDNSLDQILHSLEISYLRRGNTLLQPGDANRSLYLIRTGALEVCNADGTLCIQLSEGEWVGHRSAMQDGIVTTQVKALEDSLLYNIPASVFNKLIEQNKSIKEYFSEHKPDRLRSALSEIRDTEKTTLISTRVEELADTSPLTVQLGTTIKDAAKRMVDAKATAMIVMDKDELKGIVTEREFCTKVVACNKDVNDGIETIMTSNIITLASKSSASEALLTMARYNIRHIPIHENNAIMGMVTATDLIRQQSHNAVYLVSEVHRTTTISQLTKLSIQLPYTLVNLVNSGLSADDTAHSISSIGESITKRLVQMAEEKLGSPPVPYAFIIAGSQARNEQTAHSDQDNALILSDEFNPEQHDEYFLALAKFVSDGLDACGYIYCPGDVMSTNKQWRQPLSVWKGYFKNWIEEPEPKPLMYASIFFDLRCIFGDPGLLEELQTEVYRKTKESDLFLKLMAENALHYRPPLGLFRHFVLEKSGAEKKALNMKKRGVVPIIDLARVYALRAGTNIINTQERLVAAAESGVLSVQGQADLRDAFEFISTVRLNHQAKQIENGKEADNYVSPEELSSLERRHLKDAFEIVSTMQTAMERLG